MLKNTYIKKYKDEIWGHIIRKKNYSYTKKLVLASYKSKFLKNRSWVKTKFAYYRPFFLKLLKSTLLAFKLFEKNYRFMIRVRPVHRIFSLWVKPPYLLNFIWFGKKTYRKLKTFRVNNFNHYTKKLLIPLSDNISTSQKLFLSLPLKKCTHLGARHIAYLKFGTFWRKSRIEYIFRRRLRIKKRTVFFYETHIASPSKKKSQTSIYGLRKQYYRQYSIFYGFFKPSNLFKVYNHISTITKNNISLLFAFLESRMANLLYRVNFLPNLYFSRQFVLHKNAFVNNRIIDDLHYVPRLNEIVSFNKNFFKLFYFNLYRLLKRKGVYLNSPTYYEVDYKLFLITLIKKPKFEEINQSLSFNRYSKVLSFSRI
jgi:small subunit ribosomal protein S4